MVNNIPGVSRRVQPGTFLESRLDVRGSGANGGQRRLAIIGEGQTEEILVTAARGGGQDGLNSDYSGTNAPDGRHFQTSKIGLVAGRTQILVNGAPLQVLEESITTNPFDSRFGARVEIATGRIELQRSHLVAQGSDGTSVSYWAANSSNVGNGTPQISSTSLVDSSAPEETWTARVVSVVRDGYGDIIPGEATIAVSGSTSGTIKDANGNPIRWRSDGVYVNNGILNIAFAESTIPFRVGDRWTIYVESGVLKANDELEVRYVSELDLNDPQSFFSPQALYAKHGQPSATNTLSLAASLAFQNGAPEIVAVQAMPSVPRKTSDTLLSADNPLTADVEGASGGTASRDTIFPLSDFLAQPDSDTEVAIFVVNSDGTEEQLVLTKTAFYNPSWTTVSNLYSNFVLGASSQAYTVALLPQVEQQGVDGYVLTDSTTQITFSAPSAAFSDDRLESGEGDVGKKLEILYPASIAATYTITSIGDGYGDNTVCVAIRDSGTNTAGLGIASVQWEVIDTNETSAYFAVTDDVALNNLTAGKGLRIQYVDSRDSAFFDTNWTTAFEALEREDVQLIVPVPTQTISNIFQATMTHVESMSQIINGRWRMGLIGAIQGLTPENLSGQELAAVENIGVLEGIQGDDPEEVLGDNIEDLADYSVAEAFGNSYRMVYMAPDEIIVNILGTNTVLPGYYLAACLGGFLANQGNLAEPATYKNLIGFSILRNKVYRQIQLDRLADAGVTVVQPVVGGGKILHALTTSQSLAPEEEEISIVSIRDATLRALREALKVFIGTVQDQNTITALSNTTTNVFGALVSQRLLQSFGSVSIVRDAIEPRQYNISGLIRPVGPVNWIFVSTTVQL